MRFKQRIKVDLPQPDGPMIAVTAPGSISISTFSTARCVP